MESKNRYDGIDPYAVAKVRHHARALARTKAFRTSDIDDLEQELMLDLHRRLPAFDPARASRNTFIARVVEHCAASLMEAALAEKRGATIPHESLDVPVGDGEEITLGDTIPAGRGLWDGGCGWAEAIERRHDLALVICRLPPRLAGICIRLTRDTVTEVARDTGLSRPSIYDALAKARRAAAQVGIGASA